MAKLKSYLTGIETNGILVAYRILLPKVIFFLLFFLAFIKFQFQIAQNKRIFEFVRRRRKITYTGELHRTLDKFSICKSLS